MKLRTLFLGMLAASVLGGAITLGGYFLLFDKKDDGSMDSGFRDNIRFSKFEGKSENHVVPDGMNFIKAAEKVTPAVVHIKTEFNEGEEDLGYSFRDLFEKYYDGNDNKSFSSGSGVIISADGYILTNNHVIEDAEKVRVILEDKRSFSGKVIGSDPATDLALVKIEAEDLPCITYGNSDNMRVGEWVLAVGNPFDLTSTVTAGIISAKSRDINILRSRDNTMAIESFIQTDAAVNPGNSGGALVNLKGELIGINTAIATNTGSYAGYSFAVPVSLAAKVAEDLQKYGEVQRGLLGVVISDINADLLEKYNLKTLKGVYITEIAEGSAAHASGLKKGDVITKINGVEVNTVPALQEMIARFRPGDKLTLTYTRNNEEESVSTVLKNKDNNTKISEAAKSKPESIDELGADVIGLSTDEKTQYGLTNGLKIVRIYDGKVKAAKIPKGFIITKIDRKVIGSIQDLKQVLKDRTGGVLIEGIDPDGEKAFYGIGF